MSESLKVKKLNAEIRNYKDEIASLEEIILDYTRKIYFWMALSENYKEENKSLKEEMALYKEWLYGEKFS